MTNDKEMKYYRNNVTGQILPFKNVKEALKVCCKETFNEVPESEYLLQVAREKYPVGTKFKSAYWLSETTIDEKGRFEIEDFKDGNISILYYQFQCGLPSYLYRHGNWAEIIKDVKETDAPTMTHEKAIELLECISIDHCGEDVDAIKYAINQMKQAEVYPDTIEMIVANDEFFDVSHKRHIKGRFLKSYIGRDFSRWLFVKPVKPKPLGFSEWAEKKENKMTLTGGIKQAIDSQVNRYINYLNQFNK